MDWGKGSDTAMQKYLVIYKEQIQNSKGDQNYNIYSHTFCRKKDEAIGRVRSKLTKHGKLVAMWAVEWRNPSCALEQEYGPTQELSTAADSILETVRSREKIAKAPAVQKALPPPKPPVKTESKKKQVKIYRPYKLLEALSKEDMKDD